MKLTYYQQLSMEIDKLKEQGKRVVITQLPSTINKNRRVWL